MFNSRNLGALIVKEDPHVVAWDDNRYAIQGSSVPPALGLHFRGRGFGMAHYQGLSPWDAIRHLPDPLPQFAS